MKRILTAILILLTFNPVGATIGDTVCRGDVKTVLLYRSGAEHDFPVLVLGQRGSLVLEFDILGAEAEDLRWRVMHCDRNWNRDEMEDYECVSGFAEGRVEEYDFSFTTRRDYVHYRLTLGGQYMEFTQSGNYVAEVRTEEGDELLLRRRFCVSEQSAAVAATVDRAYDGVELERRQEVDVRVEGITGGEPVRPEWTEVWVQQNGRTDNARWLTFSGYDGGALCYRHRRENVFYGGNTFRYFDCSNLWSPMYNVVRTEEYGGEVFVLLRPEEDRSRKHYLSETTLNGGMKVNVWDRSQTALEAEYAWVNFSLPMAQPMLEGSVYIVGELTGWRMDSASRMDYDAEHRAYSKRLLLKQGYYAYQLLVAGGKYDELTGRSLTAPLEGDHRETPNRYTVFVYRHSPTDRGDRLLAVTRVMP